jgi:hypothetical protein
MKKKIIVIVFQAQSSPASKSSSRGFCVIVKFSLFKKIAGLPVDFSPLDCSQNLF